MIKEFIRGFRFAINGIAHAAATEMNFRLHLLVAVIVIGCGIFFQIEMTEWSMIAICFGMVFGAECFNTAIERLADRVSKENDPLIGHAKDLAAGAVLVVAFSAAAVGLIIFLPKVYALLLGDA